jgi:hypothetical protein
MKRPTCRENCSRRNGHDVMRFMLQNQLELTLALSWGYGLKPLTNRKKFDLIGTLIRRCDRFAEFKSPVEIGEGLG